MNEADCDDLPPPPGLHGGDESMNMTSPNNPSQSRMLVSPRPMKNPVHEIQVQFDRILHLKSFKIIQTIGILNPRIPRMQTVLTRYIVALSFPTLAFFCVTIFQDCNS